MLGGLTVLLLIMIVVDFEHYIIPDSVQVGLLLLGIVWRVQHYIEWDDIVIGGTLGLAIGIALVLGFRYLRNKEALGYGDVKFLAVAGVWLGALPLLPFLFYGGLLGILTALPWRLMGRGAVFPFGPALAVSLYACVIFPESVDAFWSLSRLVSLH